MKTEDLPGVKELHGFVSLIYNAEQLTKILGSCKFKKLMLLHFVTILEYLFLMFGLL